MRALNAFTRARASSTLRPLTADVIIEADDWLIEQPWPATLTSLMHPPATSKVRTISSPHRGLKPSDRTAGGEGSSPRFRGLR